LKDRVKICIAVPPLNPRFEHFTYIVYVRHFICLRRAVET
jgi:hypothetical protein